MAYPHSFFFLLYQEADAEKAMAAAHEVPLDARSDDGITPLHRAAEAGRAEICRVLIDRGADVNARSRDPKEYQTPLHYVSANAKAAAVLLDAGADLHAKDFKGETPLHHAAKLNRARLCELLIARGATLQAFSNSGETPLHCAALYDNVDAARVLIAAGAGPNDAAGPSAKKKRTPLQIAVSRGSREFVALMVREYGADLAEKTEDGRTLRQLAGSNKDMRDLLLSLRSEMAIRNVVADDDKAPAAKQGRAIAPI